MAAYRLPEKYNSVVLEGMKNATACFSIQQVIQGTICSLTALNSYGSEFGSLNEELKSILIRDLQTRYDIVKYYRDCFGITTPTSAIITTTVAPELSVIANNYAKNLCRNQKG